MCLKLSVLMVRIRLEDSAPRFATLASTSMKVSASMEAVSTAMLLMLMEDA